MFLSVNMTKSNNEWNYILSIWEDFCSLLLFVWIVNILRYTSKVKFRWYKKKNKYKVDEKFSWKFPFRFIRFDSVICGTGWEAKFRLSQAPFNLSGLCLLPSKNRARIFTLALPICMKFFSLSFINNSKIYFYNSRRKGENRVESMQI